ncbi:MAG: hypothetical protein K9G44_00900 [Melioribacteraceae bacterium]|nr:hypothetical protein [Melioribacteraceae bacterium]
MPSTIEKEIIEAEVALQNTLSDLSIQTAMSEYGYTEERITGALAVVNECKDLSNRQKVEYAEQTGASSELKNARSVCNDAYIKSLTIARIAFKRNPTATEALELNGERVRNIAGWISQVDAFYKNLIGNDEWYAEMAKFGYTPEKLQIEQQYLQNVIDANIKHTKEEGEAQKATQDRDAKLDELTEWISDYKTVATVALSDNQLLEKLGIKV